MRYLISLIVLSQLRCVNAAEHPLLHKIYDSRLTSFISEEQFAQQRREVTWLLIGEKHDNAAHAALEAKWIADRPGARIVFEMLDDSQQSKLPATDLPLSLSELKAQLQWPEKGWNWDRYGPLFVAARQVGQLQTGNISKALIMSIYQQGRTVLQTPRFASVSALDQTQHNAILDTIFESHCRQQSRENLVPMLHIQMAKDASMANAMAAEKTPAILIAGSLHTERAYGVPAHLRYLQANTSMLVIQMVEAVDLQLNPNDYVAKHDADILVFTDKSPEKDYCADVKGKAAQ